MGEKFVRELYAGKCFCTNSEQHKTFDKVKERLRGLGGAQEQIAPECNNQNKSQPETKHTV